MVILHRLFQMASLVMVELLSAEQFEVPAYPLGTTMATL
jgi:hypothetical protein